MKQIINEVLHNILGAMEKNYNNLKKFIESHSYYKNPIFLDDFSDIEIVVKKLKIFLDLTDQTEARKEIYVELKTIFDKYEFLELGATLVNNLDLESKAFLTNTFKNFSDITAELNVLLQYEYLDKELENFYKNLANSNHDVHIISIGCCGKAEQQVYPWVLKTAKNHPQIKFKIDLFDDFSHNEYLATSIAHMHREGSPDFILHDINEGTNCWKKIEGSAFNFNHTKLNISVDTHNTYFPNNELTPLLTEKLSEQLFNRVKDLLAANKLVIFSQHTGGGCIDSSLIRLFNKINQTEIENHQNIFLCSSNDFSCCKVYNATTIDALMCNYGIQQYLQRIDEIESLLQQVINMLLNSSYDDSFLEAITPQIFPLYKAYTQNNYSLNGLIPSFLESIRDNNKVKEFSSMQEISFDIINWLEKFKNNSGNAKPKP